MGTPSLAIINPAAGGGRCGREAGAVLDELRRAGLAVDEVRTGAPGEATKLARDAYRSGTRAFIAVGGDGTGFEIVNGLFPEALAAGEELPRLGFLPLGTGNSFLRDFTTEGASFSKAALMQGRHRPCDVVRLRHREGETYYINLLSLGFVADVCTLTNRRFKRFGEAGYGLGVLSKLLGLKPRPFPFAADGGPLLGEDLTFVSFNNSRFTGGSMMMAPAADTADGACDVITVKKLSRLGLLRTFPKIFDGTHVTHPAVQSTRAKCVTFALDAPVDCMIDGEVISLWLTHLDVMPGALEVCV
jgi:YegS/Rv2252/BmrU family lipid kinase